MKLATKSDRIDNPFRVVFDTREQLPWTFQGIRAGQGHGKKLLTVETVRKPLKTGDYTAEGFEDRICIERKSAADAVSTVIRRRVPFLNELERMQAFDYSHVIVECSIDDLTRNMADYTRAEPSAFFRSVASFEIQFPKTHWNFMGNRTIAERYAFRLMNKLYRLHAE